MPRYLTGCWQFWMPPQRLGGMRAGCNPQPFWCCHRERPPLDLRIDYSDDPLPALRTLCLRAHRSPYYDWLTEVPVLKDRHRAVLPDAS